VGTEKGDVQKKIDWSGIRLFQNEMSRGRKYCHKKKKPPMTNGEKIRTAVPYILAETYRGKTGKPIWVVQSYQGGVLDAQACGRPGLPCCSGEKRLSPSLKKLRPTSREPLKECDVGEETSR